MNDDQSSNSSPSICVRVPNATHVLSLRSKQSAFACIASLEVTRHVFGVVVVGSAWLSSACTKRRRWKLDDHDGKCDAMRVCTLFAGVPVVPHLCAWGLGSAAVRWGMMCDMPSFFELKFLIDMREFWCHKYTTVQYTPLRARSSEAGAGGSAVSQRCDATMHPIARGAPLRFSDLTHTLHDSRGKIPDTQTKRKSNTQNIVNFTGIG